MGLKRLGNIYKSGGQAGMIYDKTGLSPTLTPAKRGGKAAMPLVVCGPANSKKSEYQGIGVHDPYTGEAKRVYNPKGKSPPLKRHPLLVSTQTNGTNTPTQSTDTTTKNATKETSEQLKLTKSPNTTSYVEVFPANLLAWLEKGEDLKTLEALSFLKSLGFSGTKDPDIYYSKMLKVYLVTTREKLSRQSLGFSPTLGMECNGKYLIAKTSEFPKIGKECSLSDILEKSVDQKYFLSDKQTQSLLTTLEQ